jgi:phosphoribosylanthranilate isomerase
MSRAMEACARPRVKICCIQSRAEARLAVSAGAAALGLVSQMPSGPGVISDAEIRELARAVPPGVASFLLTCRQHAEAVARQVREAGVNTVQLCDELQGDAYAALRAELPGVAIVQVVHVAGRESLERALCVAPHVDALLLDSGDPRLPVKQLGGTGRRHDWALAREIRERAGVPIYLAGGLESTNVREAIATVSPFGLDVCTGVRTDGALDAEKLAAFMTAALSS